MKLKMEYVDGGNIAMLERQYMDPYYESVGVDDILRAFPNAVTMKTAQFLFMMGYIEGKRAERARRKK